MPSSVDSNLPKPNKRFLASVIRNVDGHNASLIRAQERAARDVRDEKGYGESSRTGRGSAASRMFGGAVKGMGSGGVRRREGDDGRRREESDRYLGADAYRPQNRRNRRGHEEEEDEHDRRRSRRRDDGEEHKERQSRRKSNEMERRGNSSRRRRHDSDASEDDKRLDRRSRPRATWREDATDEEDDYRRSHGSSRRTNDNDDERDRRKGKPGDDREYEHDFDDGGKSRPKAKRRSRSPADDTHRLKGKGAQRSRSPSTARVPNAKIREPSKSPPPVPYDSPSPPPARLSKMDKYFANTYDPRMDLGEVPREGMISTVGWDNMLAILKERGKKVCSSIARRPDFAYGTQRRHLSPTLSDDHMGVPSGITLRSPSPDLSGSARRLEKAEKRKRKDERRKRRGSDSDDEDLRRRERKKKETGKMVSSLGEEKGMFGVAYSKKGAVREWDVGK
jgi:hypothetical protein